MIAYLIRFLLILFIFTALTPFDMWAEAQARSAETPVKSLKSPTFYLEKGKTELERRQYAAAMRSFSLTLKLAPNSAEALRLRGIAAQRLGLHHKAIADFSLYIELHPRDPDGYLKRGDARNFNLEHLAALNDYDTAIKLSPRSVSAYIGRGLALSALERYDEAVKDFLWVLTINPDNTEATINMALACMHAGRTIEAVSYFEKALETERDPAWRGKIEKWLEQLSNEPRFVKKRPAGPTRNPIGRTARPPLQE